MKKILVVEPIDWFIEEFNQIAKNKGDTVYYISQNKEIISKYNNILDIDIIGDFDIVAKTIKEILGKLDCIITTDELSLIQTEKLAKFFNVNKNSIESIYINRSKSLMKEVWKKNGIKTAEGKDFSGKNMLRKEKHTIKYPSVVKPTHGFASCGVKKVNNYIELENQLDKIALFNLATISDEAKGERKIIVEEFIDGYEYSIDTIWHEGTPLASFIMSRGYSEGPYFPDYLYIIDPYINKKTAKKLIDATVEAVLATGFKTGGTHTECKISQKDNEVYIIENTARPGGAGFVYYLFEKAYDVNVMELYYYAMTSESREELERNIKNIKLNRFPNKLIYEYFVPYRGRGRIKNIIGEERLKKCDEIIKYVMHSKPGDYIIDENLNSKYFCWIVAKHTRNTDYKDIFNYIKKFDDILKIEFE